MSIQILKDEKISKYNTFKIGGKADYLCKINNETDLKEAIVFAKQNSIPIFVLGGGSNLLFSDNGYRGLIIKNEINGLYIKPDFKIIQDISYDLVTAGAGENWDEFVAYTIQNGYYGLENLSYIPGTVGASPVQNIGAYGVEAQDFIHSVKVFDIETQSTRDIDNDECMFGYRESIFKKQRGRYIIISVSFLLSKQGQVDIVYKDLRQYIEDHSLEVTTLEPKEVRDIIIDIRKNKLPDWTKWGTAGSFFKNPIIKKEDFNILKQKYVDLPGFDQGNGLIKVSLAYILDKICNAKSFSVGGARVYEKQALVIVTQDGTTAEDVINLSQILIKEVKKKTNIDIECEVEWVV